MIVFTGIVGLFCVISLCFSIFSLIHVAKYEKIRIRSKDNEDTIDQVVRKVDSLRQKMYNELRKVQSGSQTDDIVAEILKQQLGIGGSTEEDEPYEDD